MSVVKPISDLRNKFTNISTIVHKQDEPVIITKNGESDMVVMSYIHYRQLQTKLKLYEKLSIAENEDAIGSPTYNFHDVIEEIKKNFNA